MAQTALLTVVTTVNGKPAAQSAALNVHTNVNSPRVDTLSAVTTITRNLAAILSEGWRTIGVKVEMDLGDGALTEIPRSELGSSIHISKSFDGFSSECSFQIIGRKFSPFKSALIRGKRKVRLTGILGKPGSTVSRVIFDGFLFVGDFVGDPPIARVSSLDTFGKFSEKQLHYNLAPGSRKTRLAILKEILDSFGISMGEVNLGPDDGGIVLKPISVSGVRVGDFLRDFLKPTGAMYYFDSEKFHAKKFRPASVPHRTLTASDMGTQFEVKLPPTNNANNVTATGIIFEYTGPTGARTEPTERSSRAVHAPQVASKRQNKADGSLTNLSLTSALVDREVGRIIKKTNYSGGTVVSETTEEWGWYSPLAAPKRQLSNGTVQHNPDRDVYQYADGSWHQDERETYQVVRRSSLIKYFDSETGYITQSYEFRESYGVPQASITFTADGVSETPQAVYMTEDGIGWASDVETLNVWQYTVTDFVRDDLNLLVNEIAQVYRNFAYPTIKRAGVWGYGPLAQKSYRTTFQEGTSLTERNVTSYRSLDEESHTVAVSRSPIVGMSGGVTPVGPVINDPIRTVKSARPSAEQLTDRQAAQQARSTAVDKVQEALNDAHHYYIHDEAAEQLGELQTIAFEELREQGDWDCSTSTPVDWSSKPGDTIRINRPEMGIDGFDFVAWSVDWDVELSTGANSQGMVLKYFPPELRD